MNSRFERRFCSHYNNYTGSSVSENPFEVHKSLQQNVWWWLGSVAMGLLNSVCLKIVGVAIGTRLMVSYLLPRSLGTKVFNKVPLIKNMRNRIWATAIFASCALAVTCAPLIGWGVAAAASALMIAKDISPHEL